MVVCEWFPGGGSENISRKKTLWRESRDECTRNRMERVCNTTEPSVNQRSSCLRRVVVSVAVVDPDSDVGESMLESRIGGLEFIVRYRQHEKHDGNIYGRPDERYS